MGYKVVLPAAGQGKRMGAGMNKLFLELNDMPVLIHTLLVFERDAGCEAVILSVNPGEIGHIKSLISRFKLKKPVLFAEGGSERQESVYNGLKKAGGDGLVLVHDAARPFIKQEHINKLVEAAEEGGASVLAVPVKDTIKKAGGSYVAETIERSSLWAIQTPQAFRISVLMDAHEQAEKEAFLGTDDASLVERLGQPVKIVPGDYMNIKLTTQEDLIFAKAIFEHFRIID